MARAVGKFPTRAVFPALTAFSFQSAIISARTAECTDTNHHPARKIHAIRFMGFPLLMRFDEVPATMAQRLCQPTTRHAGGYSPANSKPCVRRRKIRKEINLKGSVQTDAGEYKKRHMLGGESHPEHPRISCLELAA